MNLYENILRINSLISQNSLNESFVEEGEITNAPGLNIKLKKSNGVKIGETNLINIDGASENDDYVNRFIKNNNLNINENFQNLKINNDNFIYVHDLRVEENYKGKGYGKKIMTKCHEIAKNMGYDYSCLIVEQTNHIAQSLYRKLGYNDHKKDDSRDFLVKKL
jgi:ribosomal protein S18 acetylase RimI-like enzyme